MDIGALTPADHPVEGVVETMHDATRNYTAPLTEARLFDWRARPARKSESPRDHLWLIVLTSMTKR